MKRTIRLGKTAAGATGVTFILLMALMLGLIGTAIYGLVLAFSASIILGIITLFVEPAPLIFGLVMLFFDKNLPELIMQFLNQ